ncbi:hypothetical protein NEMBOFW57_010943 [Staphylotrichum longicolle]|uniref:Uncharacterized protein n=1 Tax=Staphylotrichum longicolle TaxID=669026 RepID=A0AAD4HVQ3_9PEZI|nr:hypothetical protein NEMBOFW57_010943 [Staphylotrichum longicolle]
MALMLANQLEDAAQVELARIVRNMDAHRRATVQQLAKTLNVSEIMANSILQSNVYLPLYNQVLKGPQSQCPTEEYELEEKIFFHTFQVMADWHTGCLLRRVGQNRLRTQEGSHGSHVYPGLWESVKIEEKKKCHRAFVMETLTELHFLGSLKEKAPVQDLLSRGVASAVESKTIHLSAIFGLHLLFTIHLKLKDAGLSERPLRSLTQFLSVAAPKASTLSAILPTEKSRDMIKPTYQHIKELQGDIFEKLKVATKADVVSATPFFSLVRHPILCGLVLHTTRVLVQDTALALERNLGAINAAVHLGNAFMQEGYIQTIGSLQLTVHLQGDKSFFLGGKRPTAKDMYLEAYGRGRNLGARKNKVEFVAPAPFSRATESHLRDPLRRLFLSEVDLINMLSEANQKMREIYNSPRAAGLASTMPSPLQHAAALLHTEVPMLEHSYMFSMEVAWRALRGVQAALGGGELVDSVEEIVGRVFQESNLADEAVMRRLSRHFAMTVSQGGKKK